MKPLITITTDFGDQFAAVQIRMVAYTHGFEGELIENHSVSPFSIIEGSFEMSVLACFAPEKSVHVGVIDPGVGSSRSGIIIQTKKGYLVGPNNGLLAQTATEQEIVSIWKIDESFFNDVTNTFHGRDIFIKLAVLLSQGKTPQDCKCTALSPSDLIQIHMVDGQVIHIDDYGNLKLFYTQELHTNHPFILRDKKGKKYAIPVVTTFTDVPLGYPLFYKGSSNTLELAIHQGSAKEYFDVTIEDILQIQN